MFYGSNLYRKDNFRWAIGNGSETAMVPVLTERTCKPAAAWHGGRRVTLRLRGPQERNGPLMARLVASGARGDEGPAFGNLLRPGPSLERMTGIEPALSAWEADVLPLNYIRRCAARVRAGASAVLAQTSYRNSAVAWAVRADRVPTEISGPGGAPRAGRRNQPSRRTVGCSVRLEQMPYRTAWPLPQRIEPAVACRAEERCP